MSRHASSIWLIPTSYVAVSVVCAFALPRIERAYLGSYTFNLSISSTQAYLSAAASGMMALTAIVFSVAFVMVQFSAVAYSPRLVLFFVRDRILFHTLGVFVATFVYSLWTLAWVDRAGSGTVPLFSTTLVVVLVVISMALFSVLVQRITDLQIGNVLRLIGDKGRDVIRDMFPRLDATQDGDQVNRSVISSRTLLGPVTQVFKYSGKPRAIAMYDIAALVRQAREAGAVIEMVCAVGDTLVEDSVILRVHGGKTAIPETDLLRAVKLETERTFEQDPKYPIRLLVDIGIKALSPAINDPTTAVQTIDQIEDLLRRLGRRELDTGYAADADGNLRLVFPTPSWDDYLALAFDEIRQYGAGSVQVMRRLRSALTGLADSLTSPARIEAVQKYLKRLDAMIEHSSLEADDRLAARQEDRQGLGLSRTRAEGSRVDAR
jgi:uncharacterized membrane protein